MAILTINDVIPYLSSSISDPTSLSTNDTSLINDLIESTEQFVSSYIDNPIALTSNITELLSGNAKDFILTKHIPIANIKVYIDSTREFSAETLVASNEYEVYPYQRKIKLINGKVFTPGKLNIKVVYDTGWDINTLPADLKMVMCDIVANMYYHIRNKTESMATRGGMGTSVTFIQEKFITPEHYAILNNYRKPNV